MGKKITKVERCMDRLEGGMDRLEDSFRQLQETTWRLIERIDPCFVKEQRARSEKREKEAEKERGILPRKGIDEQKEDEEERIEEEAGAETEEEEKKEEDAVADEGKKEISNKVEEDQDRLKITEKNEHLHLDVLDQIMEKTQPVDQSHKLSNGSKTIFTIITEEISEEELPQSVPDHRRPRIGCQSFISACGDTIVDVKDSNRLNAVENNGVVVLKIKSGFNILVGEKEEEESEEEEAGNETEIAQEAEEIKKRRRRQRGRSRRNRRRKR